MVSSRPARFTASLLRLRHGDPNPRGPGIKETSVPSAIDGEYAGVEQRLRLGSYGVVEGGVPLPEGSSFGLVVWIRPTRLTGAAQVVIRSWQAPSYGYALEIGPDGTPRLTLGDADGQTTQLVVPELLPVGPWHRLYASFDASTGEAVLDCRPARSGARISWTVVRDGFAPAPGAAAVTLAAGLDDSEPSRHFNGKLDSPAVFARVLTRAEVTALDLGAAPWDLDPPPLAAWDFGRNVSGASLVDVVGNHRGELVNQPTRAVTGRRWTGRTLDFKTAPQEYSAAHFHNDDLEDACWEPAFSFTPTDDLRSGFYAIRLRAGESVDTVPFIIRSRIGAPTSSVLILAPTLTYRAYANEHESWFDRQERAIRVGYEGRPSIEDEYAARAGLLSLYDRHSDGTGTSYVSLRRPQASMRPHISMPVSGVPHGLAADLYLVDWLEERGTEYDVAADEDLHEAGRELLDPYPVVLTGTHPEYWTERMLDEMASYVQCGGRLMYLGGNGFYWVASISPDRPYLLEVRRGNAGTGPFRGEPGELHHSTTGEPGGLWRFRGRSPQGLTGVGFAAMGHVGARPYTRQPDIDPRAEFIFEGVPDGTLIGEFGLCLGAAASLELDRLDYALGTSADAMLLASATGFPPGYVPAGEDVTTAGDADPPALVRADIVYTEYPSGGAVFSVGSIGWCGALSADGYAGPVARITGNVLDRFVGRDAAPPLETANAVR
jgi:N,N-dimethylformamidase